MSIHIGSLINTKLEESGLSKSEFARRINTSPQNVQGILKRASIDTESLLIISKVLDHDFFQYYIVGKVSDVNNPYTNRLNGSVSSQIEKELERIKRENESLKREMELLRQVNRLLEEKYGLKKS